MLFLICPPCLAVSPDLVGLPSSHGMAGEWLRHWAAVGSLSVCVQLKVPPWMPPGGISNPSRSPHRPSTPAESWLKQGGAVGTPEKQSWGGTVSMRNKICAPLWRDVRNHGLQGSCGVLGQTLSSHQQHFVHAAPGTSSLGVRRDTLCPWGQQDAASLQRQVPSRKGHKCCENTLGLSPPAIKCYTHAQRGTKSTWDQHIPLAECVNPPQPQYTPCATRCG